MTDYVLGQVAAGLTKSKSKVKENKKLAALFTVKAKPPEPQKENVKKPDVNINEKEKKPVKKKRHIEEEKEIKKKKQKIDEEKFKEKVKEKEIEEPESIKTLGTEGEEDSTEKPVHWSKLTGAARRVASKESRKHDTSKDHRTIFIGNLPLSLAHKTKLKKLFGKYGAVESLRFRCPPTKDLTTSKRVAVIKKEFHPERDNMIAYVCYKEEFSAEKALFMNGKEIDGHHLRVDISTANPKANHNKSIFVGNLPFGIGEEDIREIFKVCGEVENVRIIRDNKTGLGKGFCYVAFKKKDQVELALKLDGTGLKKREIRVKRCLREPKKVQISFLVDHICLVYD
ncbi:hypothetical protein LOTGIDRAFT_161597 [Lottia gigantea]|uniref:RRM domain-containing protein n=1 Tax=Lottia gigantea TaxID=225164 RepID=V4BWT6_LOTGI|nr:hypothetical protein LOTGIDRAFT_161597 [Lottia gigantea]ESO93494.1 hypothetical protein LOTGIDRAFT_161597 [Lottia gigantea]